jgi:hypothetical protein
MPQPPVFAADSSMLALCKSNLWPPVTGTWGKGITECSSVLGSAWVMLERRGLA